MTWLTTAAQAAELPKGAPTEKHIGIHDLVLAFGEDVRVWFLSTDFSQLIIELSASTAVFLLVYAVLRLAVRRAGDRFITAGAQGTQSDGKTLLAVLGELIKRTSTLFMVIVALTAASHFITLPAAAAGFVRSLFIVVLVLQGAIWASSLLSVWLERFVARQTGDHRSIASATTVIGVLGRTAVWAVALLLILDNLGFNITALVAGLGIGGIAIGLAAQNILGDLFASLSIILDKPFEVGDFIVAGDQMGAVERIGLKTTRVRSLSGEQIVIANADLLSSRIRNYKRMAERRVALNLRLVYGTPAETLEQVTTAVRAIIMRYPHARFERCHFASFLDYALGFEAVYYITSADFPLFMDTQQAINLAIYRHFEEAGIAFALTPHSSSRSG